MIFFNVRKSNLIIHLRPILKGLHAAGFETGLLISEAEQKKIFEDEFDFAKFFLLSDVDQIKTPGVTVSADVHSIAPPRTFHVNTLHNQPVKYWKHPTKHLAKFDGFLCWGPFQRDFIRHLYAGTGLISPELFETGCPLLDPLFDGTLNKAELAEKRGLDPNNPTVLYAPSWNPGLSLREFGTEVLEALEQAPKNLNIAFRLHPASVFSAVDETRKRFSGGIKWGDLIQKIINSRPNVCDCSFEDDSIEALHLSDYVFTDISSLAWDALAIDRGVFHIDCPDWPQVASQNRMFGNPKPRLTRSHAFLNAGVEYGNGTVALKDLGGVLNAIATGTGIPPRKHAHNRLRSRLLYNPGTAQRATVALLSDIHDRMLSES